MKLDLLKRVLAARAEGKPVATVTCLATGLQSLVDETAQHGGFALGPGQLAEVRMWLRDDRSGILVDEDDEDSRLFVQSHSPEPRLLIVGAVHIAQALAPMAVLAGYGVTIIDPRGAFATADRFPGVTLSTDWPDEALARLKPDARTAVVTLTHDPKLDDPALRVALTSPCFYVGALGSRRTHAKRLERLRQPADAGALQPAPLGEAEVARIHAPVGLAIAAVSPAEIAVSILAQITAVRRRAAVGV